MIEAKPKAKSEIRQEMLALRRRADRSVIKSAGEQIVSYIIGLDAYINADVIYLYSPVRNEADISKLMDISIKQGKKVLLPRVLNADTMEFYRINSVNDLNEGYMGIAEPKKELEAYVTNGIDKSFMAVPGVAFDRFGGRIGMGKGYYDRYLSTHGITVTCGVCMDFQLVKDNKIPMDKYDRYMDCIVTENEIILQK